MASMKKRKSGGWEIRETLSDGTRRYTNIAKARGHSEAKAELALAGSREAERKTGKLLDGCGVTLHKFYNETYRNLYGNRYPRSLKKLEWQWNQIEPYFGDLNMNAPVSKWESVWEKFKKARLKKVAVSTLHSEFAGLKAMLEEACTNRLSPERFSDRNPLAGVKFVRNVGELPPTKEREILSNKELKKLYAAASPRMAALYRLAANTGLRQGELLSLQKRFVKTGSIDMGSIEVIHDPSQGLFVKTNQSRSVPLSDEAQEAVRTLKKFSMDSELLVPHIDRWTLSKTFKADLKAAGINSGAVFHSLRHTFISNLLNVHGVPLATVMKLAGHRKMQTTMSYTHSLDSQLKNAIGKFNEG